MAKRYLIFTLSLWTLFSITTSLAENLTFDPVVTHLQAFIETKPTTLLHRGHSIQLHSPLALKRFYRQRHYQPVWLDANQPLLPAYGLLAAVSEAHRHGLRPADYHHLELDKLLKRSYYPQMTDYQEQAYLDLLLTDAWLTYGSHLSSGRIDPKKVDESWKIPNPYQYLGALLQTALERGDSIETLYNLAPQQPEYQRLLDGLARYQALEALGGWPLVSSGATLKKGMHHPRVKELRARLRVTGELVLIAAPFGSGNKTVVTASSIEEAEMFFDDTTFEAVRAFQTRHGLADDGIVGPNTLAALNVSVSERRRQLEINLERWRWLPDDLGRRHVLVNIPNFTLSVVENGHPVMTANVIVGQPERPTPVFADEISHLVFNPDWYVPRTIAIKDKLPELQKNVSAFSKQGMHIYNSAGQAIDPQTVNWQNVTAANFNYRLRQDPGPNNALGQVKFMFPNRYHVYLHDTPSRSLFNYTQRAFSSGCIRVSNPSQLAEYLLKDNDGWSHEEVLTTMTHHKQRRVSLPEKVPVYLVYFTASVDAENTIYFRPDIYQHDKKLAQTFNQPASPPITLVLHRNDGF
jgi:murein L,D-transpeptidase YcbB/YkuD